MRDRGLLSSGLVLLVLLIPACQGKEGEPPQEETAKAKATVAAVTGPTKAPPTATATAEPTATATPVPSPSPLPTTPPEAKEGSAQELELIGIVRGGGAPSALIGFKGQQEIFRKGDTVFDHGTVKDVRDDSVIIRSGGNDVTLKLAKEVAAAPPQTPVEDVVEAVPAAKEVVPPRATEPLSRAESRTALKDLPSLLEKADAKRVTVGGGHGLRLGKVDAASFLAKLGLRSGDVLQKLNGAPVDDLEHLPDLSSAADGKELTVAYSRNDIGLTVARPLQ
jgi:type II secretory pathway component PulC